MIRSFSSRWRIALLGTAFLCAAGGVWSGADRTPSAAARGTRLHGDAVPVRAKRSFRVATFNIHSGVGQDRRFDLARTAGLLTDFDLVGLNEVRGPGLAGPDQAEQLGRRLGTAWLFAPAERQWWHDHFGNGVCTRLPVTDWERVPLAGTQGKGFRNFVRLTVRLEGMPVTVLVTHLDRTRDREAQLTTVIDEFLRLPPPAILMGDLNTTAGDSHLQRLRQSPDVVDCLKSVDAQNIDWIMARGFRCEAAGLRPNEASDHPLAWAELSLNMAQASR